MITVEEIVKKHVKASKELRKSFKKSPKKAKALLIKAGILNSSGKALSSHYR